MRGTVSYLVRFDQTFIPEENRIGQPGQYLRRGGSRGSARTTAPLPGRGGGCVCDSRSITSWAQGKAGEPYVQHQRRDDGAQPRDVPTSGSAASPTSGRRSGRPRRIWRHWGRVSYLLEQWATDTVQHALDACGARGLIRPSPLERIYRDLSFYVLHDNSDQVLATIGREILGQAHDASFFNPPPDLFVTDSDGANHVPRD